MKMMAAGCHVLGVFYSFMVCLIFWDELKFQKIQIEMCIYEYRKVMLLILLYRWELIIMQAKKNVRHSSEYQQGCGPL